MLQNPRTNPTLDANSSLFLIRSKQQRKLLTQFAFRLLSKSSPKDPFIRRFSGFFPSSSISLDSSSSSHLHFPKHAIHHAFPLTHHQENFRAQRCVERSRTEPRTEAEDYHFRASSGCCEADMKAFYWRFSTSLFVLFPPPHTTPEPEPIASHTKINFTFLTVVKQANVCIMLPHS